jgi:hypothetical protein
MISSTAARRSSMRNMDYILDCTAGSTGHGASAVVNLNDILNCSKEKMHDAYSYPQLQEKNLLSKMISSTVQPEKKQHSVTRTISSTVSLLQMCQLPNVRLL